MSHEYSKTSSGNNPSRSAAEEVTSGHSMPAVPVLSAHPAAAPVQKKEQANHTGLPDNLKSGIEQLSGISMHDVKVHYNSNKPAQLQAHAYAQGNEIHVAPGQEQHLPHEGWHVVQQKQGRVQPTSQLKSAIPLNDDKGLEKEADEMGAKAAQLKAGPYQLKENNITDPSPDKIATDRDAGIVQRRAFHDEQRKRWESLAAGKLDHGRFITTGFEYDIGVAPEGNALQGISHLELMKGNNGFPLPYFLETDAGNTLELVTPPYLLDTTGEGNPFPATAAVEQAIGEDNKAIAAAFDQPQTIHQTANGLASTLGITWTASPLKISPGNLSLRASIPKARAAVEQHNKVLDQNIKDQPIAIEESKAKKIKAAPPPVESHGDKDLEKIETGSLPEGKKENPIEPLIREESSLTIRDPKIMEGSSILGISVTPTPANYQNPQINVLTDYISLGTIDDTKKSRLSSPTGSTSYKNIIDKMMLTAYKDLIWLFEDHLITKSQKLSIAVTRIADTIAHQALDSLRVKVVEYQALLHGEKALSTPEANFFVSFANLISFIKDYSNTWLKTDLLTYLRGTLSIEEQGGLLKAITAKHSSGAYNTTTKYEGLEKMVHLHSDPQLPLAIQWFEQNGTTYKDAATAVLDEVLKLNPKSEARTKFRRPELFGKDPNTVGIRHDTFMDQDNLDKLTAQLGYKEALHVVEIRAHGLETIKSGQE